MRWLATLNPIVLREMRSRMRGRRMLIVLTVYVSLLGLLAGITYTSIYNSYAGGFGSLYNRSQFGNMVPVVAMAEFGPNFGKALFASSFFLLLVLLSFIAPAFGSGAIVGEKERQTYDTLLITKLGASQIIWGKVGSILLLLLLFIALALPIQSMALFFGGVSSAELLIATFALIASVFALSALGIYISTLVRSTTLAVTISYVILVPMIYGMPILILFLSESATGRLLSGSTSQLVQQLYWYTLLFLMSINPFWSAIVTQEAISRGENYFFHDITNLGLPSRNLNFEWMLSPWIIYCLFYLALAFLFIMLATRRVRKISAV